MAGPTKADLETEVDFLRNRVTELEQRNRHLEALVIRHATHPGGINPLHYELAQLILERPRSINELAEHFNREPRLISQWLFQLKSKYAAEIITTSDGKKQLQRDPFSENGVAEVPQEAGNPAVL